MKLLSIAAGYFLLVSGLSAWTPPLGIPTPNWPTIGNPIVAVAPKPPKPWTKDIPGFYYVESGGANGGNGYPGNPTNRIPTLLPPGAKVFISGRYLWSHDNPYDLLAMGSPDAPVWIQSFDEDNPATALGSMRFRAGSSYAIVTNINWDFTGSISGNSVGASGGDLGDGPKKARFLCFRNGKIKGPGIIDPEDPNFRSGSRAFNSTLFNVSGGGGGDGSKATWEGAAEQIVLSNMFLTQGGNWQYAEGDPDGSGAVVGLFAQDVWIVDCEFSYFSGGAAGFGIGTPSTPDTDCTKRTYIGRNLAHHIAQGAFWSKRSQDCVFSENTIYGLRHDTPSMPDAPGVGGQYGPRNFWIIFNTIHDCPAGIRIEGGIGEETGPITDTDIYIIGNLIYNIHNNTAITAKPDWRTSDGNQGAGTGIHLRGGLDHYIINNTIHDYDSGIISPLNWHNRIIEGNILSGRNPKVPGVDIYLNRDSENKNSISNNLIQDVDGEIFVQNENSIYKKISVLNGGRGKANISTNPGHLAASRNNFRLAEGSSAIDAMSGTVSPAYLLFSKMYGRNIMVDHDGGQRPQGAAWDLGAYEFGSGVSPGDSDRGVPPGAPKNLRKAVEK